MTALDWTLCFRPEVAATCESQANKVAAQYQGVLEASDLLQEAFIAVATHPEAVQTYLDNEEFGFLAHWVWSRLQDIARKEAGQRNQIVAADISELGEDL